MTRCKKPIMMALTAWLLAGVGQAEALPPLVENERVAREFLAVAVGDEIRNNCSSVSPRIFTVLMKAKALQSYALSLGYTADDINAMRKNPENKERLRSQRDAYLAENGVVAGDEESYCRLGRREIETETLIGSLLW